MCPDFFIWFDAKLSLLLLMALLLCRLRRVRISGAVYVRGFAQDVWPWCSALLQIIVQYIWLCCKFRFSPEPTFIPELPILH